MLLNKVLFQCGMTALQVPDHICMDKKDATHKIGKNRRDPGGRWRHTLTMKTYDSSSLVSVCFGTQTKE